MPPWQNPFTIDTSRLSVDRILDRSSELERLVALTSSRRENVLLTGPFGIGKTCILRKLRHHLSTDKDARVLLVELEMLGLAAVPDRFVVDLLLKLFAVVYSEITHKPFSNLLSSAASSREVSLKLVPIVNHVVQLYRVVKAKETSTGATDTHTFGATLGVSAQKQEQINRAWKAGELNITEHLMIAYELLEILRQHGYDQILVFGDEANHVSPDIEIALYRSNFEAFAARNMQFVFTGNPDVLARVPHFHELFPNVVPVTGFKEPVALEDLLELYCRLLGDSGARLEFTREARSVIWSATGGNPREIQRICQCVTDSVIRSGGFEVTPDAVFRACLELYDFVPRRVPSA